MVDFLIIGNKNSIICKDVWPHVMDGTVQFGITKPGHYLTPDGQETKKLDGLTRWYTSMQIEHQKPRIVPCTYTPGKYCKYDNYDAIEVRKIAEIPDYDGVMGVPLTTLDYSLAEYQILGIACGNSWKNYREELEALGFDPTKKYGGGLGTPILRGRAVYSRLLIKKTKASR